MANGFTKEQASDAPPIGPPTGGSPGSVPVVGTTVLLGVVAPEPSDWGAGAGAEPNTESLVTEVGGASKGGNCCGPASFFLFSKMQNRTMVTFRI